mgnify:CR=1 FL=1
MHVIGHHPAMPVWIDTHCHLDAPEFDADRAAVYQAIFSRRVRLGYVAVALGTVGMLTKLVKSGKTAEIDAKVTRAIQKQQNPVFSKVMHPASWAGFPPQSRTLPLAIPATIALFGNRVDALYNRQMQAVEQVVGLNGDELDRINKALTRLERYWTDQILYRL